MSANTASRSSKVAGRMWQVGRGKAECPSQETTGRQQCRCLPDSAVRANVMAERPPAFGSVSELRESLAHGAPAQELRHHDGKRIRIGSAGIHVLDDRRIAVATVLPILALLGIGTTERDYPVDDAEVFEHFERTRLNALAPRATEGCRLTLDQPQGNAAPGFISGATTRGHGAARNDLRLAETSSLP
jgi:hypothetical protein